VRKPHSSAGLLRRRAASGQTLVEFALVAGVFLYVLGSVVQISLVLWTSNTVTQVARDAARWAATQSTAPCDSGTARSAVAAAADRIARQLSLMNYTTGSWGSATTVASTPAEGVGADWPIPPPPPDLFATDCPPADNLTPWTVRVRVNHTVPVFLPGVTLLSGFIRILPPCSVPDSYCISSTAEIRMEPKAP
jgi:Flp pilus assembly protein TadG